MPQQEKDRKIVSRLEIVLEIVFDIVLMGDNPHLRNLIADVLDANSTWNVDSVRHRISKIK